jgi:predicted lipoprotein with Yx(FWY)xxD motif
MPGRIHGCDASRTAKKKEDRSMGTNNRPVAASVHTTSGWLVAAAVVAAALAVIFLLRPAETHAARATGATVSTAKTGLGRILVNSSGRTLYLFEKDRRGMSACTGQCASFWPPLVTKAKPRATGGAKASLLGTTRRADGRLQVTYNHHPVYTFAEDTKKGQTKGEGMDVFGAEWYALSTAGAKVVKASPPSSGGGGYGP